MDIYHHSHHDSSIMLISKLLEQSLRSFRDSRADEKRLYDEEYQLVESGLAKSSFSAFSEILIYSELVEGYADSLIQEGKYRKPNEVLKNLVEGDVFKNKEFHNWFLENSTNYPKLTLYLLVIDCLRYRLIKYLKSITQSE